MGRFNGRRSIYGVSCFARVSIHNVGTDRPRGTGEAAVSSATVQNFSREKNTCAGFGPSNRNRFSPYDAGYKRNAV